MDRRFVRTKKMIRNALSELVEEKGFNAISITEICDRADINRGTFYLHYTDKYDLLDKIENDVLDELEKQTSDIGYAYFLNDDYLNKPAPFLVKLFEYLKENVIFMKAVLGPKGDPLFQIKIKKIIETHLFDKKFGQLKKENLLVPEEYFISYLISAHLGVIQQWFKSGMKKSPEEMALIFTKMVYLGPLKVAGIK